jgi:hypothetical protein
MIVVFWALPRLGVVRLSAAIFYSNAKNAIAIKGFTPQSLTRVYGRLFMYMIKSADLHGQNK